MPQKKKDWTGQKYNRLTFVRPTDRKVGGTIMWELLCDCGKTHYARAAVVANGSIASCGCSRDNMQTTITYDSLPAKVIATFWDKVDKTPTCWNWRGTITTRGAPCIRLSNPWKEYSARRVSLHLTGKILSPNDRVQPLVCQNVLCVNPDHLVCGDEARFWDNVSKGIRPDDCWEYVGQMDPKGYGAFKIHQDGKVISIRAHRYSWQLANGEPPPDNMQVCHKCDNPPCVNPAHLFLGTGSDNAADMVRKGRSNSPLTPDMVREIRSLAPTMRHEDLAIKYGVSASCITNLVNGDRWYHLTE